MAWKTNTEPKIFLILYVHPFLSFSVRVFRIVTLCSGAGDHSEISFLCYFVYFYKNFGRLF